MQDAYGDIAGFYAERYGEPLVATDDWVEAIYATVAVAVDCEAGSDSQELETYQEKVRRTAHVIACITYGAGAVKP